MSEIVDMHGNSFVQNSHQSTVSGTARFRDVGNILGISHKGKRNLYQVFGYPSQDQLSGTTGYYYFLDYAERVGIATRLTLGVSKVCWRDGIEIYDGPEKEAKQILEDEVLALKKKGFIDALERADALARIGPFSILFIGVQDGLDASEPIGMATASGIDGVYFKPFAYDGVQITKWERDIKSPRYGLPVMYQAGKINRNQTEKDVVDQTINIHYSRVVHLVENPLTSEIEGMPYLQPIINSIIDFEKSRGGASEAYGRNARGKLAFEVDPDFSKSIVKDKEAKSSFRESAQQFGDDWDDQIVLAGAKANSLTTAHYSPLDTCKVALWDISGYSGFSSRVLTGEGSGQLAGSEDRLAAEQVIDDRQKLKCSGWAFDAWGILSSAGVVTDIKDDDIRFPKREAVTELQAADIGLKKAQTFGQVMAGLSGPAGGAVDEKDVFEAVGLGDIGIDEIEIIEDLEPEAKPPNGSQEE